MTDGMVTARMPISKKEAGNAVLHELGYTASRAINELYDKVLETRSWPFDQQQTGAVDPSRLAEALAYVDGIAQVEPDGFENMDFETAKRERLISKGRASEADFL